MTTKSDPDREERINLEIVVDAHDEEERAMGWYSYLEDSINFPFNARCIVKRIISPLKPGDEIDVTGMAPEEECDHEMFVMINWQGGPLGVPLSQLEALHANPTTEQAVEDWFYWVRKGYEF